MESLHHVDIRVDTLSLVMKRVMMPSNTTDVTGTYSNVQLSGEAQIFVKESYSLHTNVQMWGWCRFFTGAYYKPHHKSSYPVGCERLSVVWGALSSNFRITRMITRHWRTSPTNRGCICFATYSVWILTFRAALHMKLPLLTIVNTFCTLKGLLLGIAWGWVRSNIKDMS